MNTCKISMSLIYKFTGKNETEISVYEVGGITHDATYIVCKNNRLINFETLEGCFAYLFGCGAIYNMRVYHAAKAKLENQDPEDNIPETNFETT